MPKLEGRVLKFVEKQEPDAAGGGGFVLIEEKQVLGTLAEVREEESDYGTQWVVVWNNLTSLSGKEYPGSLSTWLNVPGGSKPPATWKVYRKGSDVTDTLSAAEKQDAWTEQIQKQGAKIHALFAIPGYTTDSDTDELVGEIYLLDVGVVAKKGDATVKYNKVWGFQNPKAATDDGGFADAPAAGAPDDDEF